MVHSKSTPISGPMIQEQARMYAKDLQLINFIASNMAGLLDSSFIITWFNKLINICKIAYLANFVLMLNHQY